MATLNSPKYPQLNDLRDPLAVSELNKWMRWVSTQLMGGIPKKGLSAGLQGIIDSKVSGTEFTEALAEKAGIGDLAYIGADLPATPKLNDTVLYLGSVPNEWLRWKNVGGCPTERRYSISLAGAFHTFNDLSDDRKLGVTVKTVAAQSGSGTPSPSNIRAISGKSSVKVVRTAKNILRPGTTVTQNGVTATVATDGTVTLNGTCTASAGSPVLIQVPLGLYLNGQFTLSANNTVAYGTDLHIRLLDASYGIAGGADIGCEWVNAHETFTLTNQYVLAYAIRIGGGVTYANVVIKPQLEFGASATGYESYVGADYALTPDAMLYGVAGQEDEEGSDGHVLHRTKLITILGTESWAWGASQPANTGLARFSLAVADMAIGPAGMCSHFPWATGVGQETEYATGHSSVGQLNIFVNKARISDWSDAGTQQQKIDWFKAWLVGKGIQVVYQLATASVKTGTIVEIIGLDGVNTVSSDGASMALTYTGSGWTNIGNTFEMASLLSDINASTVANDDFRGLLESVTKRADGLLLSGLGNILGLLLGPARISFLESGEEIMWIAAQMTHLLALEIVNSLKIGSCSFIPTTNGYLRK